MVWAFLVVVLLSNGDLKPGIYGPFDSEMDCNSTYEYVLSGGRAALPDFPEFKKAVVAQVNPCFSYPKKV